MLRARAVSAGEHDARVSDAFLDPHSGTERMPNLLDGPALAVVEETQTISDDETNIHGTEERIGKARPDHRPLMVHSHPPCNYGVNKQLFNPADVLPSPPLATQLTQSINFYL